MADGTDEDCDGRVDAFPAAGPISLSTFPTARLGGPGDRLGASLAAAALAGDALPDLVVGAPGGGGAAAEAGRAERVPGVAGDPFTLDLLADALLLGGAAGDEAGASLAVGDFDGDGQPDVAVGAPGAAGGLGRIYLVMGAFGAGDFPLASAVAIEGTSAGSAFGAALGAGDLDGDGTDDLVVGAPGAGAGAAYVFLGGAWGGISDDSQADVALLGSPSDGAGVGGAVAVVPDVDGDGVADLLVGSPGYGAGDGRVALFLGRSAASWSLTLMEDANTVFVTTGEHEELGAQVGGLGDVDGDGRGEIWMGAPGAVSGSGRVSVFRGAAGGFGALRDSADAEVSFVGIPGSAASVLVVAGDLDGDGTSDAAVGAPGGDVAPGGVFVVPGPLHALAGEVLLGTGAVAFVGEHAGDRVGERLAAPGDLSGDGRADLVIAAPGWDEGGADAGAVFVLLGI
ncbi:integrin alpha [Myxococcota bacterium]|nr:integrin alpha [Myxococcota bacterium]